MSVKIEGQPESHARAEKVTNRQEAIYELQVVDIKNAKQERERLRENYNRD
jgi:hypothetical protein